MRKSKKTGIVFVVKFNEVNVKYNFFFVPTRLLHIINFASNTINGRPRYSRSGFGPILRIHEKIKKSGLFLSSNSIGSKWNIGFLFFVPTRMLHIGNFASNTIDGRPRYSRSDFGPILRIHEEIKKSGSFLSSNSIKSSWNIGFFFFVHTRMLHIVNFASNTINGSPRYSRSDFGPIFGIHEKIRKSGFVFLVKFNKVIVEYRFFPLFTQECCILLILPQIQSMGAPGYSKSDFEPILRIHEKIRKSGFVFVVKFNKVIVEDRFFLCSHKNVAYC